MSSEELLRLPSDLISLGSHSRTHAYLPALKNEDARNEIAYSRVKLSKVLGREIKLFSFPYGGVNSRLVATCREAGYERVVNTLPYLARLGSGEFVSGRVWTEPTDWRIEFYLKLKGAYCWLPVALRAKRTLKGLFSRLGDQEAPLRPESPRTE